MSTATLTSKGQITIPIEVRNDLKVGAGDRVKFIQIAPGRYELVAVTHSIKELKGMFGKHKQQLWLTPKEKRPLLSGHFIYYCRAKKMVLPTCAGK